MNFQTHLSIAGLGFQLETPEMPRVDEEFAPFLGRTDPEIPAAFCEVPAFSPLGEPMASLGLFDLYRAESGFVRDYSPRQRKVRSGVDSGGCRVQYLAGERPCASLRDCFSVIPLEELLLDHGRMILHASCVETEFGGVLFSGPSGVGKSTQAELWKSLRSAPILNGDRVILHRDQGRWLASGSPYAGSSRYYVNRSVPVAAVVMLDQAPEERLRALAPMEAFRLLYSQLLVNTWNPDFVERVCDLGQELIQQIHILHFACTPEDRAVLALEAWLKGGGARGADHG